jgi:tetratricopeptide (TPR) repeat protein
MTTAKAFGRAGGLLSVCLVALTGPAAVFAETGPGIFGLTVPESGPPATPGPVPRTDGVPSPKPPQIENKAPEAPEGNEAQEGDKPTPDKGAGADAVNTPEQREKLLTELYARLATAPDEATAAQIAAAVEQLWQHSGSATADLLMARATAATEAQRTDLAMKLLNAAIELQPDYAEAWNRRAYLFYLEDDYKRALGDIRRVLALEPHHFKALEGLANILQHLGEKKAALEAYESLLKVHPNAPGAKKTRDDLKAQLEGQGI